MKKVLEVRLKILQIYNVILNFRRIIRKVFLSDSSLSALNKLLNIQHCLFQINAQK